MKEPPRRGSAPRGPDGRVIYNGRPHASLAGPAAPAEDGKPHATDKTARDKLDYQFDAVPRGVLAMLREKKIMLADLAVLLAIIEFRLGASKICWASRAAIAKATGLSKASIAQSIRRLRKAGLLKREPCDKPDPYDERNQYCSARDLMAIFNFFIVTCWVGQNPRL